MKRTSIFLTAVLIGMAALSFTSCKETPYYPAPGDNDASVSGTTTPAVTITKWWYSGDEDLNIPENTISVKEAMEIGKALAKGATTAETYYIKGLVYTTPTEETYQGNQQRTFYMVTDSTDILTQFYVYRATSSIADLSKLQGCWVVIKCQIMNYNGTIETAQGTGSIYSRTMPVVTTVGKGTLESPYTVADIIALNTVTTKAVYVRGYIRGVTTTAEDGTILNENEELKFTPDDELGFTNNINILLADNLTDTNASSLVVAKLPARGSAIRTALQLGVPEYAERLGQEVIICGKLDQYAGLNSVEEIKYAKINGTEYSE